MSESVVTIAQATLPGHLPLWLSVSLLLGLGVVGMGALGGVVWLIWRKR